MRVTSTAASRRSTRSDLTSALKKTTKQLKEAVASRDQEIKKRARAESRLSSTLVAAKCARQDRREALNQGKKLSVKLLRTEAALNSELARRHEDVALASREAELKERSRGEWEKKEI